jgi:hypothetical protein
MKPLCVDLFTGLHGWAQGFLAEGYMVIGVDLHDMCSDLGLPRPDGDLHIVLQDVLTLHGSQFRGATVIVASPPCQRYSYMAMPWRRAKTEAAWQRWFRDSGSPFADPFTLNDLYDACFRIQREASQSAGRHIPMIVENVNGAQPWVGSAAWHYGSYYLWGDVPAMMPATKATNPNGRKIALYSDPRRNGGKAVHMTGPRENFAGIKQGGSGAAWFDKALDERRRGASRRAAAAEIAKIPLDLARWIAMVYHPR